MHMQTETLNEQYRSLFPKLDPYASSSDLTSTVASGGAREVSLDASLAVSAARFRSQQMVADERARQEETLLLLEEKASRSKALAAEKKAEKKAELERELERSIALAAEKKAEMERELERECARLEREAQDERLALKKKEKEVKTALERVEREGKMQEEHDVFKILKTDIEDQQRARERFMPQLPRDSPIDRYLGTHSTLHVGTHIESIGDVAVGYDRHTQHTQDTYKPATADTYARPRHQPGTNTLVSGQHQPAAAKPGLPPLQQPTEVRAYAPSHLQSAAEDIRDTLRGISRTLAQPVSASHPLPAAVTATAPTTTTMTTATTMTTRHGFQEAPVTSPSDVYYGQDAYLPQMQGQPALSEGSALARTLAEALLINRLPTQEPTTFSGDPLTYPLWRSSFTLLIERQGVSAEEKLLYLEKYLDGPAKDAVKGLFLIRDAQAYQQALQTLEERFGSSFVVARAFREKLDAWPVIKPKDGQALRAFSDFLGQCLVASRVIGQLQNLEDQAYHKTLMSKLPDWLVRNWVRKVNKTKNEKKRYPTFEELSAFIKTEADILCEPLFSSSKSAASSTSQTASSSVPKKTSYSTDCSTASACQECDKCLCQHHAKTVLSTNCDEVCPFCTVRFPTSSSSHPLLRCQRFDEIPVEDRKHFMYEASLCFSCARKTDHRSVDCTTRAICDKCQGPHLTMLHGAPSYRKKIPNQQRNARGPPDSSRFVCISQDARVSASGSAFATTNKSDRPVRATMIVPVRVSTKENPTVEHTTYALLDTMSCISFVTESLSDKLNTHSEPASLRLNTMTSQNTHIECQRVTGLCVKALNSNVSHNLKTLYTTDHLTNDTENIPTSETARNIKHLSHIASEIPPLLEGCTPGLLIGYDHAELFMPERVIKGDPYAVLTPLGWTILGQVSPKQSVHDVMHVSLTEQYCPSEYEGESVTFVYRTTLAEPSISDALQVMERDFVESETGNRSQEDVKFMEILARSIKVNEKSHYEMPLPFRADNPELPPNRDVALKRLNSLSRRFEKDSMYAQDYCKFMSEIIESGHAEKIPRDEVENDRSWYIPHHGVYHDKKPGKIRVVFDCSAQKHGQSLNGALLQGPDLFNSLVGVLCRFRKGEIAFSCDVEKMFHQFHVTKEHRDFLRFLWWEDGDRTRPPVDYRMRVHIFGAVSSPGCANYALQQAGRDHSHEDEDAAQFLQNDFYVDDGLHAANDVSSAAKVLMGAREICSKRKLHLHKITSNSDELLSLFPPEECSASKRQNLGSAVDTGTLERTLGLQWCIEDDTFTFAPDLKEKPKTRRGVLATVAALFDPLGFLAPFILKGKIILQEACRKTSEWDEELDEVLEGLWKSWMDELPGLRQVSIPRNFVPSTLGTLTQVQLHHFSDASTRGYGQCSYLRLKDENDRVHCSLVMAKGRVAPLKQVTVPRLELQAATLSAKMSSFLEKELKYEKLEHVFWTDSTIVLAYLANQQKRFHVFVANRISQILRVSSVSQWNHVPTEQNPADHASRGLSVKELNASTWFSGPQFLWQSDIPRGNITATVERDDLEVRSCRVTSIAETSDVGMETTFAKFSRWSFLVRGIAKVLRFLNTKRNMPALEVLASEATAEEKIVLATQREFFSAPSKSREETLKKLNVEKDEKGFYRVGGRLRNAKNLIWSKPKLLPQDCHVSKLLIAEAHETLGHAGRTNVIHHIRSRGYWIFGIRRVVAQVLKDCVTCKKMYGKEASQKMADLPLDRVEESAPFTSCGMDCFGPFIVAEGRRQVKRYGLMITCLSMRAIHLEVLDDLSADALINGLRNVIAIRGPIRMLRCDRGTNFVGASRELREAWNSIEKEELKKRLEDRQCEWIFNTPKASHMGGVWERQIGTVRRILNGLMRKYPSRLSTSTLRTFLLEVMAIVNSRPLSVESLEDPTGPLPLTPNHILTMKAVGVLPIPGIFDGADVEARKKWRRVQRLADEFWRLWRLDFLASLRRRRKWLLPQRNVAVGDVVVLRDEAVCRADWPLGLVTEVRPSDDGLVRTCKLKTVKVTSKTSHSTFYYWRPISKLTVLVKADPDTQ
ncbi:uncharacterized protein [Littorina saxatilis]|uniref:uncharacterized protein n=1 Tax=Littorina saxatilis TaxID=31220 RepID=UPI0038B5AB1C